MSASTADNSQSVPPTRVPNILMKPEDVQAVRILLQNLLPLELIEHILEEAEYWPRIHAERTSNIIVRTRHQNKYKAAWCYLLSPPLPAEGNDMLQKARRVTIKIQAHDQGWVNDPSAGAWSWFEAIIIKPHDTQKLSWFSTALEAATDVFSADSDLPFVDPLCDFTRWHINENALADECKQSHSVVWTREAEDLEFSNADGPKGREDGHELVRSLKPGDRIALLALAQYPSWENHVFSASIDIEYAV
ncbi:hypothetical protein F5880DRAFT_1511927 [Lentinula raphanica]|nr:hypothetical protein F5880DRAFT_1511927 [Lentinula raphanica]